MASASAGIMLIERLVAEDVNVGIGTVQVSMPAGGTQEGHQFNVSSLGYFKTALWSPISPLPQEEDITTLTIVGARVGDAVLVTFDSTAFAQDRDLSVEGKVSAADTVLIILRNHSTSAQINPGSGTLRVVVLPLPVSE